jgi:hypothetical protein
VWPRLLGFGWLGWLGDELFLDRKRCFGVGVLIQFEDIMDLALLLVVFAFDQLLFEECNVKLAAGLELRPVLKPGSGVGVSAAMASRSLYRERSIKPSVMG